MIDPDPQADPPPQEEGSSQVLPATVGLVLWRHAPRGREVCALRLGERLVLPKGVLQEGEDESSAATRLAAQLCDSRLEAPAPLAPPPGEAGRVSWWLSRWAGPVSEALEPRHASITWIACDQARIELTRLGERRLIDSLAPSLWLRLRKVLTRSARARERVVSWWLADQRRRVTTWPARERDRAGILLQRIVEARRLNDAVGESAAREELAALELALHGEEAAAIRERIEREARLEREREGRAERRRSLLGIALGLAAAGFLRPEEGAVYGAYLWVALAGAIGALSSAFFRPWAAALWMRMLAGALAALAAHSLLAGAGLLRPTPGGWFWIAFAAGFAERLALQGREIP